MTATQVRSALIVIALLLAGLYTLYAYITTGRAGLALTAILTLALAAVLAWRRLQVITVEESVAAGCWHHPSGWSVELVETPRGTFARGTTEGGAVMAFPLPPVGEEQERLERLRRQRDAMPIPSVRSAMDVQIAYLEHLTTTTSERTP